MVQAESFGLGCVCPECGYRCRACVGTNTVMDRDAVRSLKRAHDAAEQSAAGSELAEAEGRLALLDQQARMAESEREINRAAGDGDQ